MRNSFFPITLIVLGAGWLVNELQIFPQANWIVIFALIAAGLLILAFEGFNSATLVKAPLLIASGIAVLLHQQFVLAWSVLIPCLLILCGLLMLLARSGRFPEPIERESANHKPRSPITIDHDKAP